MVAKIENNSNFTSTAKLEQVCRFETNQLHSNMWPRNFQGAQHSGVAGTRWWSTEMAATVSELDNLLL